MPEKIVLVTGATGQQGGATARNLVQAGVRVRALTRKPESKKAQALRQLGIEVVAGNLNDRESLHRAMTNVSGVFAVTSYWEFRTGKKEVLQNQNLADAAKQQNVQHFVLASIARCDDNPNLPHFVTKHACEQYVQSLGLPYTFLRAVYFMDNLKPNAPGASFHWAILPDILGENTTLQMIATEDIGRIAAQALSHPEQYRNQTLDIAGDEVTFPQVLAAYRKVFAAEPKKSALMKFMLMNLMPEIRDMFHWYREPRFKANISHLRASQPSLMRIEDFFRHIKAQRA